MEEIRAFACDELLQLSHGGDEVGGVLFGTRREDSIRVMTWRPIACEHTRGEGLQLSFNDRMNLAVQLEVARQNPDLKDLRPLGWFVSHLRGEVSMSPSDLEIYSGFFPETWQVTLVICPKGGGRAQAGFFAREADQSVLSETSYQTFDLEPLHQASVATNVVPPTSEQAETAQAAPAAQPAQATSAPRPPAIPVRRIAPTQPEPTELEPTRLEPTSIEPTSLEPTGPPPAREIPAASLRTHSFPEPSFQVDDKIPTRERWLWAIPIVLALGIAAFLLYQRRAPISNSSIALRATSEAQTVQLAWDANSQAIRDSDRGEIKIDDGAKSTQVSLTSDQVHAGKMSYLPQSGDVSFVMTVYPANGDPIHDSTRLIAAVFSPPIQPPQLLPPSPPPASTQAPPSTPAPPAASNDALEQEVQQLKEELGKERARADQLQNLVRILENRLGIQNSESRR